MPNQELDIVRGFVGRVRRHMIRRRVFEATVLALAVLFGWLLVSALASSWVPLNTASRVGMWTGLVALVAVVFWRVPVRSWRESRDPRTLAREIERAEPRLRNDLVTALQFGPELAERPSDTRGTFIRAHLKTAARQTMRFRDQTQRLFGMRDLGTPGRLAGLLLAVVVLLGAAFPDMLSRTSLLLIGVDSRDAFVAASEDAPEQPRQALVRDLSLELRYPAYTGLRARRLLRTSGHVEVMKGTEVHFRGELVIPAERASVVLESEDGTVTERAVRVHDGRVSGSFAALDQGTWRFRLTTPSGDVVDRDTPRKIEIQADLAPVVAIEEPKGIVDVTEGEVVSMRISAIDDFGLTRVALRYHLEGAEDSAERKPIASIEHQSSWAGEATLDLSELELQPRDVLVVQAEATDNDEVSRPKATLSSPLMLRVASPEDRHEAVLEQEQKLLEQLIGLLAEYMENPVLADEPGQAAADGSAPDELAAEPAAVLGAIQRVSTKRYTVLSNMQSLLDRMQTDGLMLTRDVELVRSLYQTLYEKHRDANRNVERMAMLNRAGRLTEGALISYGRVHRMPQVSSTERTILLLEELIGTQWLDAAQMTVNRIRETRDRLAEKLRQYKETQDPQLRAEIMKDVARLERDINELLGRLSKQMQKVPGEHFNVDAGKGEKSEAATQMQNVASSAQRIREMLDQGDIEGALRALEELDEGLQGMLQMTDQGTRGGGGNGLSQLDQRASELMDAVNDLSAAEAELEKKTSEIRDTMRERRADAVQDQLEPFFDTQKKRLDAIEKRIDDIQERGINDRDRADLSEVQRALESARKLLELEDVEGMRPIMRRLSDRAADTRRRLISSRAGLSRSDPSRADYPKSLEDAREIETEAEAMLEDIDSLLEAARPEPSDAEKQALQQLGEQQQKIEERAEDLEKKIAEAGDEFPQLEELAPRMQDAQDFMRGASGSLDRGDVPDSLENERQAMRSLRTMKQQLQQTVQKQRQRDQQRSSGAEKVVIPEEDRGPRAFHQDIMDAMKERGPNAYEDENSLYYKSLVE